jgi:hypothetical protein
MKLNLIHRSRPYLFLTFAWSLVALGCSQQDHPVQPGVAPAAKAENTYTITNLAIATPTGEIVIIDQEGKRATFATKSGVVFKQLDLEKPESFQTYKRFESTIHNTGDSLTVDAEWIGEKVYWRVDTSGLRTRDASNLRLTSAHDTPLVSLCDRCDWIGVFDSDTGKTGRYSVEGVTAGISIDMWTKAQGLAYQANPK